MEAMAMTDIQIRGSPPSVTVGAGLSGVPPIGGRTETWPTPAQAQHPPTPDEVQHAAEGVNAFLKSSGSHVQFEYYEEARQMMVEVIDDRTQEVIKTIPSKELLELAAKIGEMVGLLLDEKG